MDNRSNRRGQEHVSFSSSVEHCISIEIRSKRVRIPYYAPRIVSRGSRWERERERELVSSVRFPLNELSVSEIAKPFRAIRCSDSTREEELDRARMDEHFRVYSDPPAPETREKPSSRKALRCGSLIRISIPSSFLLFQSILCFSSIEQTYFGLFFVTNTFLRYMKKRKNDTKMISERTAMMIIR